MQQPERRFTMHTFNRICIVFSVIPFFVFIGCIGEMGNNDPIDDRLIMEDESSLPNLEVEEEFENGDLATDTEIDIDPEDLDRAVDLFLLGDTSLIDQLLDHSEEGILWNEINRRKLIVRDEFNGDQDLYYENLEIEVYGENIPNPAFTGSSPENPAEHMISRHGSNCGGYVDQFFPGWRSHDGGINDANWEGESIEQQESCGRHEVRANCKMVAPGNDCGNEPWWMKDDMLSFFMGHNSIGGSTNHRSALRQYSDQLRFWHNNWFVRRGLGNPSARVYLFHWSSTNLDHQYNVYACIPFGLRRYETEIVMKNTR
ncbi:MAG: hypothetical protein ABH833_01330 [Parcubacteria group bacterium]